MPAAAIRERFPNILTVSSSSADITQTMPVGAGAQFLGAYVDEWGRSSIESLYAVGEISCTGVHGANRLASTSLLEGLVWGDRAARQIEATLQQQPASPAEFANVPSWDESGLTADADPALIQGDMQNIQNIMWHYVGLVRSAERLSRAIRELRHLWNEIETFYRTTKLDDGLIGLRTAVEVALIVAQAALQNGRAAAVITTDSATLGASTNLATKWRVSGGDYASRTVSRFQFQVQGWYANSKLGTEMNGLRIGGN